MDRRYGSDLIVDMMKSLGIEYVALNPGSSFRGIHDSLVNYSQNKNPEIILCCHEEIAVSVAHGYAKATGRPMAAIVHNVVGLQHASMAIYNAWCDRTPILVMGGGPRGLQQTAPVDRLDTHCPRSGQSRPRFCELGRSANGVWGDSQFDRERIQDSHDGAQGPSLPLL